jgi:hypothetical protein
MLFLRALFLFIHLAFSCLAANPAFTMIKESVELLSRKERIYFAHNIGSFCEYAVFNLFKQKYDNKYYDIKTQINYENLITKEAGELDLVIFDRSNKKALRIFEVKCCKNVNKAKRKAHDQLKRFSNSLNSSFLLNKKSIKIFNKEDVFNAQQFKGADLSVIMPKKSTSCDALDGEFDLSLQELKKLQEYLIVL